jgi:hypothetical protein
MGKRITQTTLGGFRLGLAIANQEDRDDATGTKTLVPQPAWRWQVRRLGSAHPFTAFDVPYGDQACSAEYLARAWRMLQAAVTEK